MLRVTGEDPDQPYDQHACPRLSRAEISALVMNLRREACTLRKHFVDYNSCADHEMELRLPHHGCRCWKDVTSGVKEDADLW